MRYLLEVKRKKNVAAELRVHFGWDTILPYLCVRVDVYNMTVETQLRARLPVFSTLLYDFVFKWPQHGNAVVKM